MRRTDQSVVEEGEARHGTPSFDELAEHDPDWARETKREALDDEDIDDLIEQMDCGGSIKPETVTRLGQQIERHCEREVDTKWESMDDEAKASFYGSR